MQLRRLRGGRFLLSYQNARSTELSAISDLVLDGLTAYVEATTP